MKATTYIVEQDANGDTDALYRFSEDERGFRSEYLDDGEWVFRPSLISILRNLHNSSYREVTEEEAAKIAEQLGGNI
jgi:hypothetical protein